MHYRLGGSTNHVAPKANAAVNAVAADRMTHQEPLAILMPLPPHWVYVFPFS